MYISQVDEPIATTKSQDNRDDDVVAVVVVVVVVVVVGLYLPRRRTNRDH